MTFRTVAAAVQRALVLVVLAWSGVYLLLYLYRWEWNRALIAGLFFLSAQLAVSTSILLRRIANLERRIDGALPHEEPAVAVDARRSPFAWLRVDQGMSVFIPVLLGVGVILSALAYVVERVAEFTAPAIRNGHDPFASLHATPAATDRPGGARQERVHHAWVVARAVIAAATAVLLVALGVVALMEATQSRPDPTDRPAVTRIVLEVAQKGDDVTPTEVAEALWIACRARLGSSPHPSISLRETGGDRVELELRPGLGETATRRFTGCLRDATLDMVQAEVLDTRTYQ